MLLHKHHGGKRGAKKHTGVADYFAVLGIDSFLPPDDNTNGGGGNGDDCGMPSESATHHNAASSPVDNNMRVRNDNGDDGDNNYDGGVGCGNETAPRSEDYERSSSVQTVQTGNLSTAKTPKNSNRSVRTTASATIPEVGTAAGDSGGVGSSDVGRSDGGTSAGSGSEGSNRSNSPQQEGDNTSKMTNNEKEEDEEQRLLRERFEREVVELALISSQSTTATATLEQHSGGEWTCLNEETLTIIHEDGQLINSGSGDHGNVIRLAYRRRGKRNDENNFSDVDENDNDYDSNNAAQPQHYFARGVADLSIHYAKIRPSTIPNYYNLYNTQPLSDPSTNNHMNSPGSSTTLKSSKFLPGGAAKHLSSLARTATIATAVGKEMAVGLANVVKTRTPVGDVVGSIISPGNNNNSTAKDATNTATNNDENGLETAPHTPLSAKISSTMLAASAKATPGAPKMHEIQQGMQQPHHLWDTGREGSFETDVAAQNRYFEDMHSDVKLWTSRSEMEEDGSGVDGESGVGSSGVGSSNGGGATPSKTPMRSNHSRWREHFFPDETMAYHHTTMPQCADRPVARGNSFNHQSSNASGINPMEGCDGDAQQQEEGVKDGVVRKPLHEMLPLPNGFDEWVIPDICKVLELPTPETALGWVSRRRQQQRHQEQQQQQQQLANAARQQGKRPPPILVDRTHTLPSPRMGSNNTATTNPTVTTPSHNSAAPIWSNSVMSSSPSSIGMEAMYLSPTCTPRDEEGDNATMMNEDNANHNNGSLEKGQEATLMERGDSRVLISHTQLAPDPAFIPVLALPKSSVRMPNINNSNKKHSDNNDVRENEEEEQCVYIPILAIRHQRVGDNERYHEDPAIVDIRLVYPDSKGVLPKIANEDEEDDDEDDFGNDFGRNSTTLMHNVAHVGILKKSPWTPSSSSITTSNNNNTKRQSSQQPTILLRHNLPQGICDIPFNTRVLDRFPSKDYAGCPFPEEELPLFCYAGGSTLKRASLRNALGGVSLGKSYGFVVKNERGDSIYVSCLTFMEPITKRRQHQLDQLSMKRRDTSLAHRLYAQKVQQQHSGRGINDIFSNRFLVGFDDTLTLENKTICLVGRYPYWTEFRKFLTHLHLLSGSSSDIPMERHISHLLLSVPVPKPGGQCVLVPFSTSSSNEPMALVMPPAKDLPLVDLAYERLFAALDVPTVVTIVLGFLCLERKVILISTRQSLLLDCCELLKSLLFPFELCAPYVPHLTPPFTSCLEFPGATFVGIHDDRLSDGLANIVRGSIPEDSIVVELDSGEINCDGNRYETLKAAYQIIPAESRTLLIKEIESLCQDAGIVPGQEPLDRGTESGTIGSIMPSAVPSPNKNRRHHHEPLDDRAVRDAFLRFFTSILGGYERFLVVPDADFLTSGNDWFDSSKFLSSVSVDRRAFLGALMETQLFQSFVQRRTEASDVHCVLFDECLAEYHGSNVPYGRLNCNVDAADVDLLVDQCATEPDLLLDDDESGSLFPASAAGSRLDVHNKSFVNDNDTATQASSGYAESTISDTPSMLLDKDGTFAINASGDIVTIPSTAHLPSNARYSYCVDGHPCFPTHFDRRHFLPKEPESLAAELSEVPPAPILTRSEKEREDAIRLCNMTVSRRGRPQKQHRCLWQLSKFMGSQFLGAWLTCIPTQLSQPNLSTSTKSKILLRALGAIRTLRGHRRIIADEAANRALIVACGRCGTDRRVELMKLYGLMRSDGIFPNAVTLGQYTRAIAEGYSNAGVDAGTKVGMQVIVSSTRTPTPDGMNLEILDNNLSLLEESGKKWRSGGNNSATAPQQTNKISASKDEQDRHQPRTLSPSKTFETNNTQRSIRSKRSWLPISCSSSFCPDEINDSSQDNGNSIEESSKDVRLFALWSRATSCKACSYIPLDEEIQGGWDVLHDKLSNTSLVACPRCGDMITPLIGYEEMAVAEVLEREELLGNSSHDSSTPQDLNLDVSGVTNEVDLSDVPPQLQSSIKDSRASVGAEQQDRSSGFVTYLSPQKLRTMLEDLILEYGEEVLHREHLRAVNQEVFFNLWWYSARFSLPLPLAVTSSSSSLQDREDGDDGISNVLRDGRDLPSRDCCAFASWDRTVALHGCQSAAKAIMAAQNLPSSSGSEHRHVREKLFDNPNTDIPLLSFFNLQTYAQGDWDSPDFSAILVALVKACETRDLLPVVECVFERNAAREDMARQNASTYNSMDASFESAGTTTFSIGLSTAEASYSPSSVRLDPYRTILYLARYQCTTAFHAFFPTTSKACKGYHFWCAQGTAPLPIFDRAFREAAEGYGRREKILVPIPEVSGVALGFRSVFGHII